MAKTSPLCVTSKKTVVGTTKGCILRSRTSVAMATRSREDMKRKELVSRNRPRFRLDIKNKIAIVEGFLHEYIVAIWSTSRGSVRFTFSFLAGALMNMMNKSSVPSFIKIVQAVKKLNSISRERLNFRRRPILCTTLYRNLRQASNFGGTFDQLFLGIFSWNFHRRCLSTFSIPWCKKVKNDQKLKSRGPALSIRHHSTLQDVNFWADYCNGTKEWSDQSRKRLVAWWDEMCDWSRTPWLHWISQLQSFRSSARPP